MRALAALVLAALLTGCAAPKGLLANRIDVTLALDECRVDSRWTMFGLSTPIDDRDCQILIEAMIRRMLQEYLAREAAKKPGT